MKVLLVTLLFFQTLQEAGYNIPEQIIRNSEESSPANLPQQQQKTSSLPHQQSPIKHAPWSPEQQKQLQEQVRLPPFDTAPIHQSPYRYDLLSQLEVFEGGNIESVEIQD